MKQAGANYLSKFKGPLELFHLKLCLVDRVDSWVY